MHRFDSLQRASQIAIGDYSASRPASSITLTAPNPPLLIVLAIIIQEASGDTVGLSGPPCIRSLNSQGQPLAHASGRMIQSKILRGDSLDLNQVAARASPIASATSVLVVGAKLRGHASCCTEASRTASALRARGLHPTDNRDDGNIPVFQMG